MTIIKDFAVVSGQHLAPGTLFAFQDTDSGTVVAIASQINQEQDTLLAMVLSTSVDRVAPYRTLVERNEFYISYGTDWVFDLGSAFGSFVGDASQLDEAGSVIVSPEGTTLLRLIGETQSGTTRGLWFDLAEFQARQRPADISTSAIVRTWKVWQSEAERVRVGGIPMAEFPNPRDAI